MSCGEKENLLAQPGRGDLTSCARLTEHAVDLNTVDTSDNYVNMLFVLIECGIENVGYTVLGSK